MPGAGVRELGRTSVPDSPHVPVGRASRAMVTLGNPDPLQFSLCSSAPPPSFPSVMH